jgi:hypothetical protein
MELDYLLMANGKLYYLIYVFQWIKVTDYVQPNHIKTKFGLCFYKKLGPRYLAHMTVFMQATINKV